MNTLFIYMAKSAEATEHNDYVSAGGTPLQWVS